MYIGSVAPQRPSFFVKLTFSIFAILFVTISIEVLAAATIFVGHRQKKLDRPPSIPAWPKKEQGTARSVAFGQPDMSFGFRLSPWAKSGSEMGFWVNSHGFISNSSKRDDSFFIKKSPGTCRIMIFGGSTVQGVGASSNEMTIAAQLESFLNSKYRRPGIARYEVINAGVGAYYSTQELLYLATEGIHYAPDVVIVLDGLNDFHRTHGEWLHAVDKNTYTKNLPSSIRYRFHPYQLPSSRAPLSSFPLSHYILPLFPNTFRLLRKAMSPGMPLLATQYNEPLTAERGVELYLINLESMAGIARSHHINCLLALQPTLGFQKPSTKEEDLHWKPMDMGYQSKKQHYWTLATKAYRSLAKAQRDASLAVIDLSGLFAKRSETLYTDTEHYNDLGQRLVAERLAQLLSENQLLRASRS